MKSFIDMFINKFSFTTPKEEEDKKSYVKQHAKGYASTAACILRNGGRYPYEALERTETEYWEEGHRDALQDWDIICRKMAQPVTSPSPPKGFKQDELFICVVNQISEWAASDVRIFDTDIYDAVLNKDTLVIERDNANHCYILRLEKK